MSSLLRKIFFPFLSTFFVLSCVTVAPVEDPLIHVLGSDEPEIRRVMDNLAEHEVQIRYTQINRRAQGVSFKEFDFQVDSSQYFYPASTVKLPIAVLALEALSRSGNMDLDTRFYIEGDTVETTFASEIMKIFAVSDNDASNRLFEFLGQDTINNRLRAKGAGPVRLAHRLSTPIADEVTTKPLIYYLNDSTTAVMEGTVNTPPVALELSGIKKGTGFIAEDSLIEEPFDFSLKNYYPVVAQHAVLKRVLFPESFEAEEQFHLGENERQILLKAMKIYPHEAGYDSETYYDSYGKFFIYGDSREKIPENISIYNKVGYAYGTLTDCAYVVDKRNHVEFLLTATILVNSDGVFNDDKYEFESVGIPFLAELGRQLYEMELNRKK